MKKTLFVILLLLCILVLSGCGSRPNEKTAGEEYAFPAGPAGNTAVHRVSKCFDAYYSFTVEVIDPGAPYSLKCACVNDETQLESGEEHNYAKTIFDETSDVDISEPIAVDVRIWKPTNIQMPSASAEFQGEALSYRFNSLEENEHFLCIQGSNIRIHDLSYEAEDGKSVLIRLKVGIKTGLLGYIFKLILYAIIIFAIGFVIAVILYPIAGVDDSEFGSVLYILLASWALPSFILNVWQQFPALYAGGVSQKIYSFITGVIGAIGEKVGLPLGFGPSSGWWTLLWWAVICLAYAFAFIRSIARMMPLTPRKLLAFLVGIILQLIVYAPVTSLLAEVMGNVIAVILAFLLFAAIFLGPNPFEGGEEDKEEKEEEDSDVIWVYGDKDISPRSAKRDKNGGYWIENDDGGLTRARLTDGGRLIDDSGKTYRRDES